MEMNMDAKKQQFVHSKNIFQKVLMAVQALIDVKDKCPELEDIHEYMLCNYCVEGDLFSQILNALDRGVKYGFLHKKKNKYYLVCPAATILCQNKPKMCEMERIRSIFHTSDFKNRPSKRKRSKISPQREKRRKVHSCGDIKESGCCEENDKSSSGQSEENSEDMNQAERILPSKSTYEFYN